MNKGLMLLILLSAAVSACQSKGPASELNVGLKDFAITPNQLTIPASSEIQINITNDGVVVHDFHIMKLGVDAGDTFDDGDKANVYWEAQVQPDETAVLSFKAPDQPGLYQIVCAMPGHLQAGMIGTLEVVE